MIEALVMLSSLMSTNDCINRLEDAISSYREAELLGSEDLEDRKAELVLSSHLLTLHISNQKKGMDGAFDTIKRLKEIQKADQFFKTPKN